MKTDPSLRVLSKSFRRALPVLAVLASACAVTSIREVPIVEKSERSDARSEAVRPLDVVPEAPLQREAKDGTYVVRRGDTLYSIALAFGQDFRDLARWNGIEDPTKLAVGQALRVVPPGDDASATSAAAALPIPPSPAAQARPLGAASIADAPTSPQPAPNAAPTSPPTANPTDTTKPAAATHRSGPAWQWPAAGGVIATFDQTRNKGIVIAGKEGDPVVAAGDGQVVYSGSGLRGYGNLVIIKHTDDFISAYAHNRQILVKQGQTVKRGQQIAELGKTDATEPKLHFEIRQRGKPVDPLKYLPPRS